MSNFTGNDIRKLRKKHRMSRVELADYLVVSPVTVEKWEQQGSKVIRSKYYDKLANLSGLGAVGVLAGVTLAPALLGPAAILGGGIGLAALITDDGIKRVSELLNKLKKLTPEERKTFIELSKKMNEVNL